MRTIIDAIYDTRYPESCLIDFYLPDGDGPWPVFIYFHGGGLENGGHHLEHLYDFPNLYGIAVASVQYRMYPNARFPDYVEDCAAACRFVRDYGAQNGLFDGYWFGGSSAGGYLSMMLTFAPQFFAAQGLKIEDFDGAILDAGQPTTHFNILKYERGIHHMSIRCDEAAPLWYLDHVIDDPASQPPMMLITAEGDIAVRPEQNDVLYRTMEVFGYDMSKVKRLHLPGYGHCGYVNAVGADGCNVFAKFVAEFMKNPVA